MQRIPLTPSQEIARWSAPEPRYRVLASGDVAQLAEHLLCKQDVVGSIPIVSTFESLW